MHRRRADARELPAGRAASCATCSRTAAPASRCSSRRRRRVDARGGAGHGGRAGVRRRRRRRRGTSPSRTLAGSGGAPLDRGAGRARSLPDPLHVGDDRPAQGRAADAPESPRRRAGPRDPVRVPVGRAHARGHAALSHDGHPLAHQHRRGQRLLRLPARLERATAALSLIEAERITALYLIPTLYHELVHAPGFSRETTASVTKLAYAGAPMLATLTEACVKAFRPRGVREPLRLDRDLHVLGPPRRPRQAGLRRTPRHPFGAARGRGQRPSGASAPTRPCRRARRARSSPASTPTRPSPATGSGPTRTRGRCARAGTSRATWATSTPPASSSCPGAWTT